MSAYLNTRVSLYAGRLWRDVELDALVSLPDDAVADKLIRHELPQLVAGYASQPGRQQDPRSLEQRIIAQVLRSWGVKVTHIMPDGTITQAVQQGLF